MRLFVRVTLCFVFGDQIEHLGVFDRDHLGEVRFDVVELVEHHHAQRACRCFHMRFEQLTNARDIGFIWVDKLDQLQVAMALQRLRLVVDIRDAARHARSEVEPHFAQHQYLATGHVFAAVFAYAFHHQLGS